MAAVLYATNKFPGDGVTVQFEFAFSGGYMAKADVKAYIENQTTFARTPVTVTDAMFVNATTLNLGVSAPVGSSMVIYRDTPKAGPLVDFAGGSRITESNLDKVAKQSVFIGAEVTDATNVDAIANIGLSAGAAAASAAAAAASYDSFDDRYLGAKTTAPTLDNDGAALLVGALYFDTVIGGGTLRVWSGTAWNNLPATTAAAVSNTPAGAIAATTVQAAINELDTEKAARTELIATAIANTPAGAIAATTVQAAINELDTEKAKAGANSDITSLTALSAGGLPDNSVLTADIANAQITAEKLSGAQTGSAPVFGVRAWVNFNGTGVLAIRASGNVSSVTDNGVGDYTINFTTALPDGNYAVHGLVARSNRSYLAQSVADNSFNTASSCRVNVVEEALGAVDSAAVLVSIIR